MQLYFKCNTKPELPLYIINKDSAFILGFSSVFRTDISTWQCHPQVLAIEWKLPEELRPLTGCSLGCVSAWKGWKRTKPNQWTESPVNLSTPAGAHVQTGSGAAGYIVGTSAEEPNGLCWDLPTPPEDIMSSSQPALHSHRTTPTDFLPTNVYFH